MTRRLSRRQALGIGATSFAAGVAWPRRADAQARYEPGRGPSRSPGSGAYWQKTYSGGPVDVAPLAPGLPGQHYRPVVVPNGAALPFKIVD